MKNVLKKLITLCIVIVMTMGLCVANASAETVNGVTYPTASNTYDIYNLVRNASKSGGATNMIPQGICFAGDYLLISAYSADNSHNSLIYVFTASDRKYFGTIKLPFQDTAAKNHAGGVAYDCNRSGNVWVSIGKGVGCFKYSELAKCKGKVYSIKYDRSVELSIQASTLCYDVDNDRLWVGYFTDDSSKSYARCYQVNSKTTKNPTLHYEFKTPIPLNTQGISVRGSKMLITTSHGRNNDSKIYAYTWNQSTQTKKQKGSAKTLPPLAEGVVMGPSYAYLVYESVANEYYSTCKYPLRYFAQYKLSDLGL